MQDSKHSTPRHRPLVSTRGTFALLAVLLALGMFAVSALPTEKKHALHTQGLLHPWLHIASFALLALLLVGAVRRLPVRLLFVLGLLGFAYLTEARESRKDGWPIEQQDLRTDAIGVFAGATAGFLLGHKTRDSADPKRDASDVDR